MQTAWRRGQPAEDLVDWVVGRRPPHLRGPPLTPRPRAGRVFVRTTGLGGGRGLDELVQDAFRRLRGV